MTGNGALAVAEFEKDRFDAVLLDINMPVLDGVGPALHASLMSEWRRKTALLTTTAYCAPPASAAGHRAAGQMNELIHSGQRPPTPIIALSASCSEEEVRAARQGHRATATLQCTLSSQPRYHTR